VGLLMAVAMRTDVTMPFDFPSLLWKFLVEEIPTSSDIDRINCKLVQYLKELETITEEQYNAKYSDKIHFSVISDRDGEEIDLIPNGKQIPLPWDRRKEYVEKMLNFQFKKDLVQFDSIKRGIGRIIPVE